MQPTFTHRNIQAARIVTRYLAEITFKDGSQRTFRWPTKARARACLRDFPGAASRTLRAQRGFFTFEGFQPVEAAV